jgi:putative phosphoesterase
MRIGLISDTHGLIRPEAVEFLSGSQVIIHCGDICEPNILAELRCIAPVTAVRGNNDHGTWADQLPEYELLRVGGTCLYIIHDLAQMDLDPVSAGVAVVLSGHSHKPAIERRAGILYVNPGSAGPRRFKLPISAGELIVEGESVTPRLVDLEQLSHG